MPLDRNLQPPKVVSFVLHAGGMGHASRLIQVHTSLRELGFDPVFVVEREQPLVSDYGFRQIMIPSHPNSLIGDDWFDSGDALSAMIAKRVIETILAPRDLVLHDVAVHRTLYECAERAGCRQFLIHRARRGRPDPLTWAAATVPSVDTVYVLGREGYSAHAGNVRGRGVSDIVRESLDDKGIWRDCASGCKVYIAPGGGGYPDSEELINAALGGISLLSRRTISDISAVVATGPHFRGMVTVPADMKAPVRITSYLDATHSWYRDTDVAIVHGGYNTVQEIRSSGIRAIVIPGRRPFDDQRGRIERLTADCPNVLMCEPTAEAIFGTLQEIMTISLGTPQKPAHGAAEVAADIVTR